MLELALYILIFEFFDRYLSRRLNKQLKLEESSKRRILIRRKVKRNRIILLTCFVFFLIGTEILHIYNAITQPYNSYIINLCIYYPGICLLYFKTYHKWERIKGNISILDLDSFNYVKTNYSLFLRGFDSDDYSKVDGLENPKVEEYERLSEYWFFKLLSKKYKSPIVSVGMTQELDCPVGTKRVYLDDKEWKAGVKTLMENADRIFILVSDRESCIWEIAQTKDYLNKTIYIIDNEQKYNNAKEKVSDILNLPALQLTTDKCAIIPYGLSEEVQYFDNSRMGYSKMLGVKYTSTKTKRKRVIWWFLIPWILLVVFIIASLIAS